MAPSDRLAQCGSSPADTRNLNEPEDGPTTSMESSVDVLIVYEEAGENIGNELPESVHAEPHRSASHKTSGQGRILPENTEFVVLSFEGADLYSAAGGLGVRVTNLCQALASSEFNVRHFFVGDPNRPGEETSQDGKLTLNRWCQWISRYYPNGVYQGENEKLHDFNESIPWFVLEHVVKPAVAKNKLVVIMGEEWHTAEVMCRISDVLHAHGLRNRVVMFWNANNTFSFHRINWGRLAYTTTITTVSRYMKQIMWGMGLNPLVIPNGIPRSLLNEVDHSLVTRLKDSMNADLILTKVARWDPDKRWNMAVEATARLKARGLRTVLLARGGIEPHGEQVLYNARSSGLNVHDVGCDRDSLDDYLGALADHAGADLLNIRFHCPQDLLRILYSASDAVLANSGHEPFGLVGLEAMAAGGVAVTGCTGEDYAVPFYNAIVLETSDPAEIEGYVTYLDAHPREKERIRKAGKETAALFTWEEAIKNLTQKLEYQARLQGLLAAPKRTPVFELLPARAEHALPTSARHTTPTLNPVLVGGV